MGLSAAPGGAARAAPSRARTTRCRCGSRSRKRRAAPSARCSSTAAASPRASPRRDRRPAPAAARQGRPGSERRPAGRPLPADRARAAPALSRERARPRDRGTARAVGSRARRAGRSADAGGARHDEIPAGSRRPEASPRQGPAQARRRRGDLYAVLTITVLATLTEREKRSTRSFGRLALQPAPALRLGTALASRAAWPLTEQEPGAARAIESGAARSFPRCAATRARAQRPLRGPRRHRADAGDESVATLIADLDHADMARDLAELRSSGGARPHCRRHLRHVRECGGDIGFDASRNWRCAAWTASVHEKTFAGPSASSLEANGAIPGARTQ